MCGRLQKYAALAELTRSWPLASRVAIDNTDPEARFLDKTVMLGPALTVVCARRRRSNELRV